VRFHAIFRIRELVRALARKARRTAVLVLVLAVLAGAVVVGKNTLLNEVRKGIRKNYTYSRLTIDYFPPALVIEDLRSLAEPPAIKVKKVRIEVPYLSLLRNRKSLSVTLDGPEFRIVRPATPVPRTNPRRPLSLLSLPFIVERGIIENGVVIYESGKTSLEARGVRGVVTQSGPSFTVRATADSSGYAVAGRRLRPIGGLTVLISGLGNDVTVERLAIDGTGVMVNAAGRVRDLSDPTVELEARFEVDTEALSSVLRMPFRWKGRANGQGRLERKEGRLTLSSDFASDDLAISGVPMGRVRGRFDLDPETGSTLTADIAKPGLPAESLTLSFRGERNKGRGEFIEGRAAPLFLDPIFRDLDIPWPVRTPAVGTFTLENQKLVAEAEFSGDSLERQGDLFAFRGPVRVGVDFRAHHVTIDTPGLESSFGSLEAKAAIDLGGDMDTRIRGQIADVKETREFVALVLREKFAFGEIRGQGYADVRLTGRSKSPDVSIQATLSPGGFETFNAADVGVDAKITAAGFDGRFEVDDPSLKGVVRVQARTGAFDVDVENGEGEMSVILPALDVPVALSGRAAGNFRMTDRAGEREFSGTFTSPEVQGYGQTAKNVSGRLEWKGGRISFPELAMDLHGGHLAGRIAGGIASGEFDADLRGEEMDFQSVVGVAGGRLSFSLAGKGVFGQDWLGGLFSVKDLALSPLDRTEARGGLRLDISGGRVRLEVDGQVDTGDNPLAASFTFPLSGEPFFGTVKGTLTNLDLVVPWDGAQGRLNYVAEVQDAEPAAQATLSLDAAGPLMPLPGFAYAITDFTFAGTYAESLLKVTSLGGKLGGGPVTGSGEVGIGEGAIATMDMRFEAKDMVLAPIERMRAQADASLRILKDKRRFVTEGEILFKRLNWRREIYEEFSFSSRTEPSTGPSFFDGMSLNIRLRADENATIENSLGRFDIRFNLTATGAFESPVLLGDIDLISGDFYFQDRSFRVIHGRLSFTDPVKSEPYLDFRGETYVKDYRVTLELRGPTSSLKPEFTSSPPLAPEEILSLLALGESFRRMYYSYAGDRSTALNTASLLTYQIADLAKKRTGGLFSLDRLRIDPYIPEGAPGGIAARITVGKKVSKNLLFLYSTILANSTVMAEIDEVPIFRMEWDISRRFSLVGGRDDRGRLGFDVKYRRRF
jgi:TamB, inner membrane protein subunit of TAM complex